MKIQKNTVVALDYILKDNEGEIIDQSNDGHFLYLHGAMNIVPGLEAGLADKQAGDELSIKVSAQQGYGEKDPARIQEVPKAMFEDNDEISVGMVFHAEGPAGNAITVTVTEIKNDSVMIDGNHALAGCELNFDVQIISVREASEEEIAHGHVHGADGHNADEHGAKEHGTKEHIH